MAVYTIPLEPEPQSFTIALGGKEYRLTVRWFDAPEGGWLLDLATVEDEPVIAGIPLGAIFLSSTHTSASAASSPSPETCRRCWIIWGKT